MIGAPRPPHPPSSLVPSSLAPYAPVASPCINICRMNESTGWCEGCQRTLPEIAAWGSQTDEQRRAVLAQLPLRQDRWRSMQRAAPAGDIELPP
jgi:hypothetical protein